MIAEAKIRKGYEPVISGHSIAIETPKGQIVNTIIELRGLGIRGIALRKLMIKAGLCFRAYGGEFVKKHPCNPKGYCGPAAEDGWAQQR